MSAKQDFEYIYNLLIHDRPYNSFEVSKKRLNVEKAFDRLEKLENVLDYIVKILNIKVEPCNIPHEPFDKIKYCLKSDIWIKGISKEMYDLIEEVMFNG